VARDPDSIQQEIEQARNALAESLDALSIKANPKRIMANGAESMQERLADPKIKYGLIAVAVLIVLLLVRRLFR
jgi:hypothetical protein